MFSNPEQLIQQADFKELRVYPTTGWHHDIDEVGCVLRRHSTHPHTLHTLVVCLRLHSFGGGGAAAAAGTAAAVSGIAAVAWLVVVLTTAAAYRLAHAPLSTSLHLS